MTKLCNSCEYLKFCARSDIEDVGCDRYKKDTTTNKEWLQTATTEQLVEFLLAHMDCIGCPASCEKCHRYYDACKETILEWLKQPHRGES